MYASVLKQHVRDVTMHYIETMTTNCSSHHTEQLQTELLKTPERFRALGRNDMFLLGFRGNDWSRTKNPL